MLIVALVAGSIYHIVKVNNLGNEIDALDIEVTHLRAQEFAFDRREEFLKGNLAEKRAEIEELEEALKPSCLGAEEIRDMLISRSNPDVWATYFDSAEVESQGICCGPGYEITAYNDVGQIGVVFTGRDTIGHDSYVIGLPGLNDDTTFTSHQWLRYSRFEARQCRKAA